MSDNRNDPFAIYQVSIFDDVIDPSSTPLPTTDPALVAVTPFQPRQAMPAFMHEYTCNDNLESYVSYPNELAQPWKPQQEELRALVISNLSRCLLSIPKRYYYYPDGDPLPFTRDEWAILKVIMQRFAREMRDIPLSSPLDAYPALMWEIIEQVDLKRFYSLMRYFSTQELDHLRHAAQRLKDRQADTQKSKSTVQQASPAQPDIAEKPTSGLASRPARADDYPREVVFNETPRPEKRHGKAARTDDETSPEPLIWLGYAPEVGTIPAPTVEEQHMLPLLSQPYQPPARRGPYPKAGAPPLTKDELLPETLARNGCRWLDDYIRFSKRWSPGGYELHHEATGVWVASSVAGRRIHISLGDTITITLRHQHFAIWQ
jgi:hypothetical protein